MCWHENFAKHQNLSKYYDQDCLKNFLLLFTSWLAASIVKNSPFLAEIYFIFLENVIHQTSKAFNTKFGPQWKDRKSSYQVRQIFALFCKLVALILGLNCIQVLRVTKIVKQIKFEGAWWKVRSKILFAERILAKIYQTNCSFFVKQHATGKVQFVFFKNFLLVLTKL